MMAELHEKQGEFLQYVLFSISVRHLLHAALHVLTIVIVHYAASMWDVVCCDGGKAQLQRVWNSQVKSTDV